MMAAMICSRRMTSPPSTELLPKPKSTSAKIRKTGIKTTLKTVSQLGIFIYSLPRYIKLIVNRHRIPSLGIIDCFTIYSDVKGRRVTES